MGRRHGWRNLPSIQHAGRVKTPDKRAFSTLLTCLLKQHLHLSSALTVLLVKTAAVQRRQASGACCVFLS
jgi:hypothetical protein